MGIRDVLSSLFLVLFISVSVIANPGGDVDISQLPHGTSFHFKIKNDINVQQGSVTLCAVGDLSLDVEIASSEVIKAGTEVNLTITSYGYLENNGDYDFRRYFTKLDGDTRYQEISATINLPNVESIVFRKFHTAHSVGRRSRYFTHLNLNDLELLMQQGCNSGAVKIPSTQDF